MHHAFWEYFADSKILTPGTRNLIVLLELKIYSNFVHQYQESISSLLLPKIDDKFYGRENDENMVPTQIAFSNSLFFLSHRKFSQTDLADLEIFRANIEISFTFRMRELTT